MAKNSSRLDANTKYDRNSPDRVALILRAGFASGPWLLLAVAIYLQVQAGRTLLPADLAGPDPPAHFTTGVMLYDFLRSGWAMSPMHFAESFYFQYPKVALGHWPPVFYVLQAIWYMVFAARITAARWLCAAITAWSAWILYRRSRMHLGHWHGMVAAGLLLGMPVVRAETWNVMSDLLIAGLAFCAICSLSDYLASESTKDALLLALWTSLSILTKGTGWLLIAVIAVAPFVARRLRVYAKWRYWGALSLAVLLSAPFYVVMSRLGIGYPVHSPWYVDRILAVLRGASPAQWIFGAVALAALLLALRWWLRQRPLAHSLQTAWLMATWCCTLIGFIVLIPLTAELDRYFIGAIAPASFIAAGLLFALKRRIDSPAFLCVEFAAVLGCAVYFASVHVKLPHTTAYSQALNAIPAGNQPRVVLLGGDEYVEGAVIAASLSEDSNQATRFVRGSKFMASSDWDGYNFQLRYRSPEALQLAMDDLRIDYIILDESVSPKPDLNMLKEVLAGQPASWTMIARRQVDLGWRHGEIVVLRRNSGNEYGPPPEAVSLGKLRSDTDNSGPR